jgi:hypothetical protein
MKYLLIEKSKRVNVKPYQRKGKYVVGYTREDPRNRKVYLDSLVEKVKALEATGRIRVEKLPTNEQQYLISRGIVFDVDRMGKPLIGYSRERSAQDLREKVLAGREKKVGEPYEIGTAFINVPQDFINFVERTIPKNELKDLKSVEEFSFNNFQECKTIPPKPFLDYLEKEYNRHPDYGGMYFHDIGRFVLNKTNISFEKHPSLKKTAFLHEIGHHQWWHHTIAEDRKEFISIWQKERIGKVVLDMSKTRQEKYEILETPETTSNGRYKVKNLGTGKIEEIEYQNIDGLNSITPYANANAHEGFAEAYAEYRYGTLDATEFPDTYHLLFEIFDKRRLEKQQNVLVEHFGEAFKVSGVEKLFSKLENIRTKEKAKVDYPYTDNVIDLLKRVEKANTPKDVKQTTVELDDYLKRGIGWQIEGVKEAGDVFGEVYEYAMEKRKKFITKKYDTTALDEVIKKHKKLAKEFKDIESQQDLVSYLEGLKNTIEDNWKIGLYEESEFPTLKQEVNHAISFLKRKSRKFEWAISEKAIDSFANLREII